MRVFEEIRPAVKIYCEDKDSVKPFLKRICEGLEEEGVPFEIDLKFGEEPEYMAVNAARESRINVGIFIGKEGTCILQHAKMPYSMPIMKIYPNLGIVEEYRTLGANAARLVKNMPLKF